MKTLLNRKNESGFTLIEMVVAVGVLLALAVGGFLAYSGHQHRAKVAVTEAAAQEVYNGGRLAQEQGQAATTARDEFNATTDAITTDIEEKSDRTICATAQHNEDESITASRGSCSGESENNVKPPTSKLIPVSMTCETGGNLILKNAALAWNSDAIPAGSSYALKTVSNGTVGYFDLANAKSTKLGQGTNLHGLTSSGSDYKITASMIIASTTDGEPINPDGSNIKAVYSDGAKSESIELNYKPGILQARSFNCA